MKETLVMRLNSKSVDVTYMKPGEEGAKIGSHEPTSPNYIFFVADANFKKGETITLERLEEFLVDMGLKYSSNREHLFFIEDYGFLDTTMIEEEGIEQAIQDKKAHLWVGLHSTPLGKGAVKLELGPHIHKGLNETEVACYANLVLDRIMCYIEDPFMK